jgi:hypothetical protein
MTSDGSIPCVNSLFQQPWWLDAVAPGQWKEIVLKRGEDVVARLPYVVKKRYGLMLLTMPKLTQTLGPWLRPSMAKYTYQLSQQKELMTELIEHLPPHDLFLQNFHHSIDNWLPFYWHGFRQTTCYTYVIGDLSDLDRVWSEASHAVRKAIRKAERTLSVSVDPDIEKFLQVNAQTFHRQGIEPGYSLELVRRLDAACVKHRARRILLAEDAQGRVHAGLYVVWDENSAYYLMGGADPDLRQSGAQSLLMWEAIKFAATVTKRFDFEGSMVESIEHFFRAFGALQKPYFEISRMSHRMRMLMSGRDLIKNIFRNSRVSIP